MHQDQDNEGRHTLDLLAAIVSVWPDKIQKFYMTLIYQQGTICRPFSLHSLDPEWTFFRESLMYIYQISFSKKPKYFSMISFSRDKESISGKNGVKSADFVYKQKHIKTRNEEFCQNLSVTFLWIYGQIKQNKDWGMYWTITGWKTEFCRLSLS